MKRAPCPKCGKRYNASTGRGCCALCDSRIAPRATCACGHQYNPSTGHGECSACHYRKNPPRPTSDDFAPDQVREIIQRGRAAVHHGILPRFEVETKTLIRVNGRRVAMSLGQFDLLVARLRRQGRSEVLRGS